MIIKKSAVILSILISQSSWAQLSCTDLFQFKKNTAAYFAEQIDRLNQDNHNLLFQKNLVESVNPLLKDKTLTTQVQLQYQSLKLKWLLRDLKSVEGFDKYDLENFSKKLERLAFLTSSDVTKKMSLQDKSIYQQARHSLLVDGLESYFFSNTNTPLSVRQKVFNLIMLPFQDIYFRWTYALFYMPKLNGAIMPPEIAAEVLWKGVNNTRELTKPYLIQTQGKYFFNVFSSAYNWTLVSAIFIGLPAFSYLTFSDLTEKGEKQAVQLFTPMLEHSKKSAEINYHELSKDKDEQYFYEEFKRQNNREPNQQEVLIYKKLKN